MKNKVFIGNLPWKTTSDDLAALLRDRGYAFRSARVIEERDTGKSRGFAFVEFETPEGAEQAIENLNDYVLDGRPLIVSEAREKEGRSGGGSSGGSRSGGDGGGFRDAGRSERSGGSVDGRGGHDRRGRRDRRGSDERGEW